MIESNIAFLTLEPTATEGYIGAVLVTNGQGIPQEFRCTHSVKPTPIQRQLYGGKLVPHIAIELSGKPLLKEIRSKISMVLVKDQFFLELRLTHSDPVLYLVKKGGIIDSINTDQTMNLESPSGEYEPIIVRPHPAHEEDVRQSLDLLRELRFDPLEPFVRIQTALQALGEAESKYR